LPDLIREIKAIGIETVAYMPTRNTPAQLQRLAKLCEENGMFEISGEDVNSPRQKFACAALALPEYSHLIDATWALIGHEAISTKEGLDAGMFSEKTKSELPNIKDRMPVSEAVSLNTSQVEEIARLNTGVAVVHQSGWLNPVLCKIDLFPSESFCPLDYTPYEVPKDLLLKARGVFLELLLCKRMKRNVPPKQYCADAMDVLSLSRDKNDKKLSQYIKDYLAAGKMTAWNSFDEMCRIARTSFDSDKLFNPFPNDVADWNKKAHEYMKDYVCINESTITDFLAVLIMSRNSVNPQAKSFYFKWLADQE